MFTFIKNLFSFFTATNNKKKENKEKTPTFTLSKEEKSYWLNQRNMIEYD